MLKDVGFIGLGMPSESQMIWKMLSDVEGKRLWGRSGKLQWVWFEVDIEEWIFKTECELMEK